MLVTELGYWGDALENTLFGNTEIKKNREFRNGTMLSAFADILQQGTVRLQIVVLQSQESKGKVGKCFWVNKIINKTNLLKQG